MMNSNETLENLCALPGCATQSGAIAQNPGRAPGEVASVMAKILLDASRDAERYVKEYRAGMGAE